MATDPTRCASCGREGETQEHPLTRGGPHLPSVNLCTGCLAVVRKRQPHQPRTPAKAARRASRPPADPLPGVEAIQALDRL